MRATFQLTIACVVLLGSLHSTNAASITWTTGPNFGGATGFDAIQTNGTLVEALDADGLIFAGPLVVDAGGINITFTAAGKNPPFSNGPYGSGSPGSTDANWNSILNSTLFNVGNFSDADFLTGLTVGNEYQIQLFASDLRNVGQSARTQFYSDGLGNNSATITLGSLDSIVGTFVADSSTQTIGITNSATRPVLDAYVLRDVTTVPEPMSVIIMCIGSICLVGYRCRVRLDQRNKCSRLA